MESKDGEGKRGEKEKEKKKRERDKERRENKRESISGQVPRHAMLNYVMCRRQQKPAGEIGFNTSYSVLTSKANTDGNREMKVQNERCLNEVQPLSSTDVITGWLVHSLTELLDEHA